MMECEALIGTLRAVFAQEAAVPALRGVLFLLGVFGAFAWWHRRRGLSLGFLGLGAFAGLAFWLIQIASPLGLGTDRLLTREWAQAGVNAFAEPRGSGFVWGTEAESSFISTLSALRVPLSMVQRTPQIATLLGLGLVAVLPFVLLRNRTTAALAAGLAMGGGLWPGLSPYDALLHRPSLILLLGIGTSIALWTGRRRTVRTPRALHPGWLGLFAALAALDTTAITVLLGSLLLTPPLRALLRLVGRSPGFARRLEGALLLCVFSGSGLFWWNPTRTVSGFLEATGDETALQKPLRWLAANVGRNEVILTSPTYSALVAAHAGRRVLFPPPAEGPSADLRGPFRRTRLRDSVYQGAPIARLARDFSLTHLFLGPGEPSPPIPPTAGVAGEPRLSLVLVYEDVEDFRVFRLAKK